MPNAYPIFNSDPNVQSQAALLDQRQALAQALMQAGLQPSGGTEMAGGMAVRKSPLEGLAKIFQAYMGSKMLQQTTGDRGNLAAQAYAAQLQANQPQTPAAFTPQQVSGAASQSMVGGRGPTNDNAKAMAQALVSQQPANPGTPFNPRNPLNMPAELMTGFQAGMIPKELYESQAALYKPTDATMAAKQGNMDPVQANQQAFAKSTVDPAILKLRQAGFNDEQIKRFVEAGQIKDAEIDRKAGNQFFNFITGASGTVPKIPENANPVGGVAPNGALPGGVTQMPGALPMAQANAGADAAGKAPFNVVEGFSPETGAPFKNYAGNVLASPGSPAKVPAPVQAGRDQERLRILQEERKRPTNSPEDNAAIDREIKAAGGVQSGPTLGQAAGAQAAQTELSTKWAKLTQDNASAQTVIARLQTVKQLGPKAITGYGVERRDLMNGLLSIAGIKGAEDAKTASDLVDKNAAQIVTALRMGQGGAGTDALQSQLSQANPSRHMTMEAIHEAVDNLSSVQQMMQAKTKILQAHANDRDPTKYSQKEVQFDQNADPRIWQMKGMSSQQLQQFTSKLPPAERQALAQKYSILKQNGWLQ